MRILVTGAGGYIGEGVVSELLRKGHSVVATDIDVSQLEERNNLEVVGADLFSVDHPYDFFSHPDALVHLAWRNGFSHWDSSHVDDLPRHFDFIGKMSVGGLSRICIMGTMHEVGYHEGVVRDDTPCNPSTPYGISKNALRQLCFGLSQKDGIDLQWLRGFYLVSEGQRGASIFCKIAQAAERGDRTFPFTSGKNEYDFLPYGEFCHQVAAAVVQDSTNGIINICSGKPETLGSAVERFIDDHGYEIRLDYGRYPDRPYDSPRIWGDDTKIRKILAEESGGGR
jgi:dTDP-6-deoxy-L-talose 4-dehydrogenase (NAD+)